MRIPRYRLPWLNIFLILEVFDRLPRVLVNAFWRALAILFLTKIIYFRKNISVLFL